MRGIIAFALATGAIPALADPAPMTVFPGPLGSMSAAPSAVNPATITGTGTAPNLAVFTSAHTIGNAAVASNSGGTTCADGTLALGFSSDSDTGFTLANATGDIFLACNGTFENMRWTSSGPSVSIGGVAGGTDDRFTVNTTNGQPKVALIQTDNADTEFTACNGFTTCSFFGEGHSSASHSGTGAFNAFFGNEYSSGNSTDGATIIYGFHSLSTGAIRINNDATGLRLTIASGTTTMVDGAGIKKVLLGTTTPISFPGVTSVAALVANTGDAEIDLQSSFVNLIASGVAGCTAAQGAAYSVAAPGSGGFAACSNGTAGQPVFMITNAGVSNSAWNADGTFTATGSVTAPGFAVFGDADTGIYGVAANDLGITAGGVLHFDVSTTASTSNVEFTSSMATASSVTTGTCSSETCTTGDSVCNAQRGQVTATCTAGQTVIVTFAGAAQPKAPTCTCTAANAAADVITLGDIFCNASTTVLTINMPTAVTAGAVNYTCFE